VDRIGSLRPISVTDRNAREMVMSKLTMALLVAIPIGSPPLAHAEPAAPSWCCPTSCISTEGPVDIGPTGVTAHLGGAGAGARTVPFSKNIFLGQSPDEKVHLCIGFTDFGDRELKCLLIPAII